MKRLVLLLALLATPAFGYSIKETKSNENINFYVAPSGTPTRSVTIDGATAKVGINSSTTFLEQLGIGGNVHLFGTTPYYSLGTAAGSVDWRLKDTGSAGSFGFQILPIASGVEQPASLAFTAAGAATLSANAQNTTHQILADNPSDNIPVLTIANSQGTINGSEEILRLNWSGTGAPVSTAKWAGFYRNGSISGSITWNGTSTLYNATSDQRLKEEIRDMEGGLSRVLQLQPRHYRWKESGIEDEGLVAQEVREVIPSIVTGDPDSDVTTSPMTIDYGKLTPVLIQAVKELKAQHDALKSEFAAYKTAHP